MIEANGFTGRVWEATPADKLARDLVTGPGALPMVDAGIAFGELSTVLTEAASEYQAILGELADAWRSAGNEAGVQRLAELRNWMAEAAEAAAVNAASAEAQAVAYTTALAAMPGEAEQAVCQAVKDVAAPQFPLGGSLLGTVASRESEAHAMRSVAAQVMRSYEAATTPVAQPWTPPAAPVVTSDAALLAERQVSVQARAVDPSAVVPRLPVEAGTSVPAGTPTLAAALGERVPVDRQAFAVHPVAETATPSTQLAPPPMVPMAPAAANDHYSPVRPAASSGPTAEPDALGSGAGMAGTPAVFGAGAAAQLRSTIPGQERT
ncbi:PPE domain-containing protein [Nocardia sp. NEAU-G5]|uniref:PPE domain-containing protein n=1 Tax=Nocardia albiluteola TaxID=2842303 RepID=A0ABS6B570_9NOCA|nr:PPE domain-containing protein [Nocardia albiluteola]MBU3064920.1 PPE domain-containing protein [Nocardia albiluteola]